MAADHPHNAADEVPRRDREADPALEEARAAEDDDLEAGLSALSKLATGRMGLKDTLLRVAELASRAIPGADGVGLTLLEEGRPDTIVATKTFVTEVDEVQYGLKQGPCVSAVTDQETVSAGSLVSDDRWPQFGPQSAGFGIQSSLSIPLITSDGVVGCMNVYAHEKDAFDDRAARLGDGFSVPAAIAVQNAQILAESKRLASHLRKALNSRMTVERAVGVLMSRNGGSADAALAKIRNISQSEHKKMDVVAQSVLDTAVRRARAHRSD